MVQVNPGRLSGIPFLILSCGAAKAFPIEAPTLIESPDLAAQCCARRAPALGAHNRHRSVHRPVVHPRPGRCIWGGVTVQPPGQAPLRIARAVFGVARLIAGSATPRPRFSRPPRSRLVRAGAQPFEFGEGVRILFELPNIGGRIVPAMVVDSGE